MRMTITETIKYGNIFFFYKSSELWLNGHLLYTQISLKCFLQKTITISYRYIALHFHVHTLVHSRLTIFNDFLIIGIKISCYTMYNVLVCSSRLLKKSLNWSHTSDPYGKNQMWEHLL